MKKHILHIFLIFNLLFSNLTNAQEKTNDTYSLTDAIQSVTDNFSKLIEKANNIGTTIDKSKFYSLSSDILYNLQELKQAKINLLIKIEQGYHGASIKTQMQKLEDKVEDLQNTLIYNKGLIKGLNIDGFDAIALSADLGRDFTGKSILLKQLYDPQPSTENQSKLTKNLTKGIELLNSSILKLTKFTKSLRTD